VTPPFAEREERETRYSLLFWSRTNLLTSTPPFRKQQGGKEKKGRGRGENRPSHLRLLSSTPARHAPSQEGGAGREEKEGEKGKEICLAYSATHILYSSFLTAVEKGARCNRQQRGRKEGREGETEDCIGHHLSLDLSIERDLKIRNEKGRDLSQISDQKREG